jgi:hypothetical protein
MLNNSTYNLLETASVISKGLHRYDTFKRDAQGCQHCQQMWDQMKRSDEQQLEHILPHLKQHLDHEADMKKVSAA